MKITMMLAGFLLAAFSLYAAFIAGSDLARIRGASRTMMAGAACLTSAALVLAYRA